MPCSTSVPPPEPNPAASSADAPAVPPPVSSYNGCPTFPGTIPRSRRPTAVQPVYRPASAPAAPSGSGRTDSSADASVPALRQPLPATESPATTGSSPPDSAPAGSTTVPDCPAVRSTSLLPSGCADSAHRYLQLPAVRNKPQPRRRHPLPTDYPIPARPVPHTTADWPSVPGSGGVPKPSDFHRRPRHRSVSPYPLLHATAAAVSPLPTDGQTGPEDNAVPRH